MSNYTDYIVDQTVKILSIDSPTGFTGKAAQYVMNEYRNLGFDPILTKKGGVIVCVSEGKSNSDAVLLEAHMDTLGAMVCNISGSGRLELTPLGGMNANNAEAENCRVYTRDGRVYSGAFQLKNASVHVNSKYNSTERTYATMEVVLDEIVESRDDVEALGIMTGDVVCFDPRTTVTESGYIKSRFLDDKLSVGILLGYAKYLKENSIVTDRKIYQYITVFEEVGHGGSASVPAGVTEAISIDMGCVGNGLDCTEHTVSICAKDSGGPYSYSVVRDLIAAAEKVGAEYAVDVYPHYGSDVEATLRAGYDLKHGLIGAGVYASHGYERSHRDGVENTLKLLCSYLG